MIDYTELKRLAEAAKGWKLNTVISATDELPCRVGQTMDGEFYPVLDIDCEDYNQPSGHLASYIVAASPDAVLGLIAEIDRLRTQNHALLSWVDAYAETSDAEFPDIEAKAEAALTAAKQAQPVFQSRPWSKEAEMLESWTQAQAAQPPPYCNICEGRGEVDTGIDESPVTICNSCNGTGIAQAAQPPRELVQQLVDVLTAESIRCDALTAGRAWLEANAEVRG